MPSTAGSRSGSLLSEEGGEDGEGAGEDVGALLLDERLLAAHRAGDLRRLVALYAEAAEAATARGDTEAAAFYRTHAYVFALEAGDERASELHAALKAAGRDE